MRLPRSSQTLGTIISGVVALYLVVYLVQTIKHNYDLQQQINLLQQQTANLQAEKDELSYKIRYYQTDSYQEKEARSKLGLQQQGEGVVILPRTDETTVTKLQKKSAKAKSNWQQWTDFLSGSSARQG